ncbi:hypothetical protein ACV22V_32290, partial [Burkholderia sp. AW33-5]
MSYRDQSFTALNIFLARDAYTLASGTAFIYKRGDSQYLVTNWHNVTGRNSLTHAPLDRKNGALPNLLGIRFPIIQTHPDDASVQHIAWIGKWIRLYDPASRAPIWFEHPEL